MGFNIVGDHKAVLALLAVLILSYSKDVIISTYRLIRLLLTVKFHSYFSHSGSFSFVDKVEKKFDSSPSDRVQFTCAETGNETTVGEVESLANQVAHWGKKVGLKQYDSVALMMLNCPEFVSIWLGFGKIGVSAALLNTNSMGDALVHSVEVSLKSTDYKLLIVDLELKKKISDDLVALEKKGIKIVFWDTNNKDPKGQKGDTIEYEVALQDKTRPSRKSRDQIKEKDPLMYIFTSGTTGFPKACKITQTRYYIMAIPYPLICALTPEDRIYTTMPMYHSAAGILGVGAALTSGATLVFRKKFSVRAFTSDCLKYKITTFQYIGELCRYLVQADKNPDDSKLSIRSAFGNGLSKDIWTQFKNRYGVDHIVEFYGATEGNAGLINNFDKVGSLGFVPRFMDIIYPLKIIKAEEEDQSKPYRNKQGRVVNCRPNEKGLMICQINPRAVDTRFDGYSDSKSTEKKILKDCYKDGDQYFNTGDLLSRDWLGFYYWCDRVGDTFRWKGENVATSEVHSAVDKSSNAIKELAVYGIEVPGCDGKAGMVTIVVEGKDKDDAVLKDIAQHCKKHLPVYARPLFIRIKRDGKLKTTTTFKTIKVDLIKEGFDASKFQDDDKDDKLYYYDAKAEKYEELTEEVFKKIQDKKLKL